jgi:hypothetical protein
MQYKIIGISDDGYKLIDLQLERDPTNVEMPLKVDFIGQIWAQASRGVQMSEQIPDWAKMEDLLVDKSGFLWHKNLFIIEPLDDGKMDSN